MGNKQRINKENQGRNTWHDDTTDIPILIGQSKNKIEKNYYSKNYLSAEARRLHGFQDQKKKRWHKKPLAIQTTLLYKVVQQSVQWFRLEEIKSVDQLSH